MAGWLAGWLSWNYKMQAKDMSSIFYEVKGWGVHLKKKNNSSIVAGGVCVSS